MRMAISTAWSSWRASEALTQAVPFGANGFQIGDVDNKDRIVALQTFDKPLERFWALSGEQIVH